VLLNKVAWAQGRGYDQRGVVVIGCYSTKWRGLKGVDMIKGEWW
jgi:hypothetical protein